MEALAASFGLSIAMLVMVALLAGLLFPVFWVWMLIDAIIREKANYPSADESEKLMWVLLMAFMQPVALLYFFIVWRAGRAQAAVVSASAVTA